MLCWGAVSGEHVACYFKKAGVLWLIDGGSKLIVFALPYQLDLSALAFAFPITVHSTSNYYVFFYLFTESHVHPKVKHPNTS